MVIDGKPTTDEGVGTVGGLSAEAMFLGMEPASRPAEMIRRSGGRLGLSAEAIELMIAPQEVRIFRLSCPILGLPTQIRGVIALHSNARGPYKGGIRLSEDVSVWETVDLARLMTLKTALSDIEFGGGKTGIRLDWPSIYVRHGRSSRDREFEKLVTLDVISAFARNFRDTFRDHAYIPAPDLGTGAEEMAAIYHETRDPACVTGKADGVPGWLPGRREATGYGCASLTLRVLEEVLETDAAKSTVAIQGFGNVGQPLATRLHQEGCKIVAVTDISGGAHDPDGLDVRALIEHAQQTGGVHGFGQAPITNAELFNLPVDALVPAAGPDVITAGNADNINARVVVEAANMPVTMEALDKLHERGVLVLPDILANAGGVVASLEEYSRSLSAIRMTSREVLNLVTQVLDQAFESTLGVARAKGLTLVDAATEIAVDRVYTAMRRRRSL